MAAKVAALTVPLPTGTAVVYLGEDWVTQGDWVGRYGRQYAVLCAARSPIDHYFANDNRFKVLPQTGPQFPNDFLRAWVSKVQTTDPRALYDPIPGYRRQSEWDDHGEVYDPSVEGPDLWLSLTVPDGVHCVSLYFVNDDGHGESNERRDYVIEWKKAEISPSAVFASPPLARARVRYFYGGVYKSFVVRGPSRYFVRIRRNNSKNTLVNSVLADQIAGRSNTFVGRYSFWMGEVNYDPPQPNPPSYPDAHILDRILAHEPIFPPVKRLTEGRQAAIVAQSLWSGLQSNCGNMGVETLRRGDSMLAFRAALAGGASSPLQANWRWNLHLWTASDRQTFTDSMRKAHDSQLEGHPEMKTLQY